ncbi:MAG: GntR family transcriptional regulator [Elainellaceae cyanobacterium]
MVNQAKLQLPLHLSISEKLRTQIFEGHYAVGEQLPSEHQLMEMFDVSRITVRRAIANLSHQGLVNAQRGRGVFVNERQKITRSLANPLTFVDEESKRQGVRSSVRGVSFELVDVPDAVRQTLRLDASVQQVYCQEKIILANQHPVAIDITYMPQSWTESLVEDLQSNLLYPTLERHGISVERVETVIECTHATYETAEPLDIPLGAPLLVNRYTTYSDGEIPILCGETLSRGDRLSYSVVLVKQSSIAPQP